MLGKKVECKVTGFNGIAVSRIEYINGCVQFGVSAKVSKDGTMPSAEYIDEKQLKIIGDGIEMDSKPTGGPQRDAPKH